MTKTLLFARERQESVFPAGTAPQAQKPMGKDSTLQKLLEVVYNKLGQLCSDF